MTLAEARFEERASDQSEQLRSAGVLRQMNREKRYCQIRDLKVQSVREQTVEYQCMKCPDVDQR